MSKKVALIMGSDSDLPIVKNAVVELKKYGVDYEVHVMSAHRTPTEACEFSANAEKNGFGVIICFAGMAAHLAGVVAGHTILPVIAVPIKSTVLEGMDALLSSVMMPKGVPVSVVAINGGANAGILAVQMLALSDETLAQKLRDTKKEMAQGVREKDANITEKLNELL
ncbi:MAG: 5-(carboxyamino)imidazole ribonucleotide mutase [Oscillospiraceae bacterium]